MKKLILLVCFLFIASPKMYSQVVLSDDFDYPVGDLAGNGVPPWTPITATAVDLNVVPGSLTFPNYLGSGIGNSVSILSITNGEDDTRLLSSPQNSVVYSSFLINVVSALAGDYFYAMNQTTGGGNFCRVYARTAGAGLFNLGMEKSSGTVVYSPAVFTIATTYLVIVKYSFIAGTTNDEMSLFVYAQTDPVPSSEPAPLLNLITTAGTDPANLDRSQIRQGTAGTVLIFDGLSVSTTWNDNVLPVELSSFTSTINKRDVTLNWTTSSETNNSGFEIERASNNVWTKVGNVAGNGTVNSASSYSFTDRGLATGNYNYRLKQIDFNGNFEYFNLSNEINIGVPSSYDMSQNYPNPFNPSTTINFDVPFDGSVSIRLFDMSGKEVATLVNEVKTAGYYSVNFNASSLSSGVYFYNISANNFSSTKKMTLLK